MEGLQDDMGDGSMQCADHPYKNNIPPGGICAFCLQEKLGKLVSSSFPIAVFPSSSPSPSSPSFRSQNFATSSVRPNGSSSSSLSTVNAPASNSSDCHHHHPYYSRRARIPFLLTSRKNKNKKKKEKDLALAGAGAPEQAASMVFKRSQSTTTPGRRHFMGSDDAENEYSSPRKRGFWSFLYLSSSKYSTARRIDKPNCNKEICYSSTLGSFSQRTTKREEFAAAVVVEEEENDDDSPSNQAAAFDRKVSRSRSVGCGSRSFSGDFFERISNGFGDCTLRRVESQREGKPKVTPAHRGGAGGGGQDCIKERVKCGGLFSGFMITSSSSTSSSSSYWVSSSAEDKAAAAATPAAVGHLAHGRSRSWGWAFASPIRAFSKPSSVRREGSNNNNKNTTPNLNAIPSLLAVRG